MGRLMRAYHKGKASGVWVDRCPACAQGGSWMDWFCPKCGAHWDERYIADGDGLPRTRDEIVAEYRSVGMDAEADRLKGAA